MPPPRTVRAETHCPDHCCHHCGVTDDPRATLTRKEGRASSERATLDSLLDEVPVGVLSTVVDGMPWSVPMFFARDGDRVLLHGSTGAGALRQVSDGAPATLTVLSLDGFVVAFNAFESSANYRSAVLRGTLQTLSGPEAAAGLETLTDRLFPGRTREVVPSTTKELSATVCLSLPIAEGSWLYKCREGGSEPPDGEPTRAWTGVVPLRVTAGEPERDAWNTSGAPVPDSVHAILRAYPR
ncbi:pyridoxamine 5'-phosphate oxidase family protein [Nostocoides sp. HKS02]|nr:pyridoxamine 5'-phosphate oxidase family protein [Tetrasphaera sp. HKS02]